MGRIVVINHLTLDGVMQGPGRPEEDVRDGFAHGGWAAPGVDEQALAAIGRRFAQATALLFGRRTYEDLAAYWPTQPDHPFTRRLEAMPKHVASRTRTEPLPWRNSHLLREPVEQLKQRLDGDAIVMGSGELVRSLIPTGAIDEYLLLTHPLVLGEGRRLFTPGVAARLRLVESETNSRGVVISAYVGA